MQTVFDRFDGDRRTFGVYYVDSAYTHYRADRQSPRQEPLLASFHPCIVLDARN